MSGSKRIVSPDGRFDLNQLLQEVAEQSTEGGRRDVAQGDIQALFADRKKKSGNKGARE